MLKGTFIEIEPGKYGFENISQSMNKPEQIRLVWPVTDVSNARNSMRWVGVDDALNKEATLAQGMVSVYCGQGAYITGYLEGGAEAKAAVVEVTEVPRPKVRNHVEVRWHHDGYHGFWQKYLKSTGKGWVRA